ncbi:MAG: IspD/TarI family cytidylyltransferase [Acidimicrobiales bacterium]
MPPGRALPNAWAVVVAGGSGARFGGYKQFALLGGREVVDWSLEVASRACQGPVLVVPRDLVGRYRGRSPVVVAGGATRPESVRAGLLAVPAEAEVVVVHDAARPLASVRTWGSVIAAVLAGAEAAVPCVAVTDTIKQRQEDGSLLTLERGRLVASQTPQAFSAEALRAAHAAGGEATDDAALVEAIGGRVVEVPGDPANLKITSPADLVVAEALLAGAASGYRR